MGVRLRLAGLCCASALCAYPWSGARADALYEFVIACQSSPLGVCFQRIEHELDEARAEGEGTSFCIPRVWGAGLIPTTSYPVSVLDYILLRLSAARVGRAGQPVQAVLRDTLGELFPCRHAARPR
jgi:hypothetical protein